MSGWDSFFAAQVGASAALAGLVFVGISINLTKIIASGYLPNRAQEALLVRAKANSDAQKGQYDPSTESAEAGKSLYEKGYKY